MVIPNTCPNLSDVVQTDSELGRVIQTVSVDCILIGGNPAGINCI